VIITFPFDRSSLRKVEKDDTGVIPRSTTARRYN